MENAKCFWKLVLFYFILFLPFYFPRKLILFYLKGKGGRIFCGLVNLFVDSACRRTRVMAKKSTTPSLFTYFWDPNLNHLGLFGMVRKRFPVAQCVLLRESSQGAEGRTSSSPSCCAGQWSLWSQVSFPSPCPCSPQQS